MSEYRKIWDILAQSMEKYPLSVISCEGKAKCKYTYREFLSVVDNHGRSISALFPAKCKCAIVCESELHAAMAVLASWRADLVIIPLSLNYGEKHCKRIVEYTLPDVLIVDDETDIDGFCEIPTYNIVTGVCSHFRENCDLDTYLCDAALIMCTSGTTGFPKGAVITEHGLISNLMAIRKYFRIESSDTILLARPIYHCAVLTGELLIALVNGVNIVFLNDKYTPHMLYDCCTRNQITVLCGTPTLFRHFCSFLEFKKQKVQLKNIVLSGECLSDRIALLIRGVFPFANIYHVYGLTEASPRVSYLPPEQFDMSPVSVGVPVWGTQIKIVDEKGELCRDYEHGDIMVKSPSLLKGYYKNPELTNCVLKDGWLVTGDIGYQDETGKLYILSRKDDLIIKAGMNIYPKEVENQVIGLPQIVDCIVYGYINAGIQSIAIDVVLHPAWGNLTVKDIKVLLAEALPQFQLPTKVSVVDSIARNASGKVIRNKSNSMY